MSLRTMPQSQDSNRAFAYERNGLRRGGFLWLTHIGHIDDEDSARSLQSLVWHSRGGSDRSSDGRRCSPCMLSVPAVRPETSAAQLPGKVPACAFITAA